MNSHFDYIYMYIILGNLYYLTDSDNRGTVKASQPLLSNKEARDQGDDILDGKKGKSIHKLDKPITA